MKKILFFYLALGFVLQADAQQYKLRQVTSMAGMKTEFTVFVKGMRKRTEGGAMMGIPFSITTIEQCDLKRIIKLNDKKKLYLIEKFSDFDKEAIGENEHKPVKEPNDPKIKGGVIHIWYSITDTGERKKMYGYTARHIWTSQKIVPSAEACSMKDSLLMKTDGWYIDLPEFNCPQEYSHSVGSGMETPGCKDRFVMHQSGKGKLGFPLIQTTTLIMNGRESMTTTIETIEFTSAKLDSLLFVIPPGYKEVQKEEELMDMGNMMQNMNEQDISALITSEKKPGMIRIGVLEPEGGEELQPSSLQQHMISNLTENKIEAVAVKDEEDARRLQCDYLLSSKFENIKQSNKVGGLIKAIRKSDPNAASTYQIQANMKLLSMNDHSVRSQPAIDGKFEGRINDAAGKALDEGCRELKKSLQ